MTLALREAVVGDRLTRRRYPVQKLFVSRLGGITVDVGVGVSGGGLVDIGMSAGTQLEWVVCGWCCGRACVGDCSG